MDLTPKQQTSEAIRQAQSILVTTGQHPSVDQVSAVIGLAMILAKFGKSVTAVVSDSLPQAVQMLETARLDRTMSGLRDFVLKVDVNKAEVDKLRYEVAEGKLNIYLTPLRGNFAPSDVTFGYGESHFQFDLAMVLGVPTRARIDRIYEQNLAMFSGMPVINLDFHRSNENYGAVNLIEPNASSLCEMLVALSESLQSGIVDADIATALLMGIVASTDRFTASHTTSKSLTVAAQMMAAGARQQAVVRALYRDGSRGDGSRGEAGRNEGARSDGTRPERQGGERGERQSGVASGAVGGAAGSAAGGAAAGANERSQMPRDSGREARTPEPAPTPERPTQAPAAMPVAESEALAAPAPVAAAPAVAAPVPVEVTAAPAAVIEAAQESRAEAMGAAAAAEPVAESVSAPVLEPAPPVSVTEPDVRPFRAAGNGLPIIDPGHIELSPPEEMAEESAGPIADFTAAAQILAERPVDDAAGRLRSE